MIRSKRPSARGNEPELLRRAFIAAFGFLGIVLCVWSFLHLSSNSAWFFVLLITLSAINLLAWVLEPLGQERSLPCKGCGRLLPQGTPTCHFCGASGSKVPL